MGIVHVAIEVGDPGQALLTLGKLLQRRLTAKLAGPSIHQPRWAGPL